MTCCVLERPTNNPRLKQRFTRRYLPTVRTVTVKSSGGDYSSLSSAEAGEQGDLVSLDRQLDIECYSFQDTSSVTIDGWTTDATRYIRVYTPSTERHDGKFNTSKYRLHAGTAFSSLLTVNEDYTRLQGLQIYNSGTNNSVGLAINNQGCVVESCIVRLGNASSNQGVQANSTTGTMVTVRNTVIYCDGTGTYGGVGGFNRVVTWSNCTIVGWSIGILGHEASLATNLAKNCYVSATTCYSGLTLTTCASSDTTGSSGLQSIAASTSVFTNVTAGSEDFHLVSGSPLIDAGTDLSGDFTTDIDGATRSGTWDVGADEFAGGGGGTTVSYLMLLGVG